MPEKIVLVNNDGQKIGTAEKLASHHGKTPLHLGFSCYVFDKKGRFLFTQRAKSKKVWPGVWTNSVCGHPAPEENIEEAIKRRLDYELGMSLKNLTAILPDYRYKTPPFKGIIENEICPVYVAIAASEPVPNAEEVEDYEWIEWQKFLSMTKNDNQNKLSYWCKDQAKLLEENPELKKFLTVHCS